MDWIIQVYMHVGRLSPYLVVKLQPPLTVRTERPIALDQRWMSIESKKREEMGKS